MANNDGIVSLDITLDRLILLFSERTKRLGISSDDDHKIVDYP